MNKVSISIFFAFILFQGCFFVCLFRPENVLEEVMEQFSEEKLDSLGSVEDEEAAGDEMLPRQ